jgi:Ni/Co efflux regulator RcnB
MRAKAQKLALLVIFAASSLLAPAAFARPQRSAHTAAKHTHKAAEKPRRASASKRSTKAERGSSKPRKLSRNSRKQSSRRAAEPRSRRRSARQVPERETLRPVPIAPQPALPPIEVHHDRKQHLPPAQPAPPDPKLMADSEGLERVQDDADLDRMRAARSLVPIPAVAGLQSDERLPLNRRYCRPWTAQFLSALARAHYARFRSAIQVNSAVRTVEFQQQLLRVNGNAAPAEGDTASPHLTGQAVDIAKHGLSMTEIAWMRAYLLPLVQQGKIDVEEEFQQSCFHISIYEKYVPSEAPRRVIPARGPATSLAAAIP